MMFLQFFIAGAFIPVLSLYLKDVRHFSGTQSGLILSVTAAGSILSPLVTSFVADRIVSAERLLGILHLLGGVFLFLFASQEQFLPLVVLYSLYTIASVPTFALTSAIVFHHSPDARHKFGEIRVWGTLGWIAVAWLFGCLWLGQAGSSLSISRLPDALLLAAISSAVLGIYAFTLPARRVAARDRATFIPAESLAVFRNPVIIRLCIFMMGMSFFYRFYYFGTAPFLNDAGFAQSSIMPLMSLGQITEVGAMMFLSRFIIKWGPRKVVLCGLSLDLFRYAAAALGAPGALVIAGLVVHGLAYTFVYTTVSIYLDRSCDDKSRTGVHQIFLMITSGFGSFAGSIFCGMVMDAASIGGAVNYHLFWLVPTIGLSMILIAMALMKTSPPVPLSCRRGGTFTPSSPL
jgi:nucleoside transporter